MERIEYEVMATVEIDHWWYGGMRAVAAALLDPCYQGASGLRILDAGCGTGGNALFLRRYGAVFGLDLAPEALTLGAMRIPHTLARGSVLHLPYATASFDLVTSFEVLYHRAVPDERGALDEVRRVLRPGGRMLLRLPAFEWLLSRHDQQVHTRRRYTVPAVVGLLHEAGFVVERITYVMNLLFPVALVSRILEQQPVGQQATESAMNRPAKWVNQLLRWPLAFEAAWIGLGGTFPYGLSIICLARSQDGARTSHYL